MSSRKHPLCRIALLCALLGLISLLPCLIGSHGQLLYYGDYLLQYIPFLRIKIKFECSVIETLANIAIFWPADCKILSHRTFQISLNQAGRTIKPPVNTHRPTFSFKRLQEIINIICTFRDYEFININKCYSIKSSFY